MVDYAFMETDDLSDKKKRDGERRIDDEKENRQRSEV